MSHKILEVAIYFLKLGFTAFGGPAAHIALMHDEVVNGVNVASLGLMAGVTLQLGATTLLDLLSIAWGILSAILLFGFRINSTWLIMAGAVIGFTRALLG